MYELGNCSVVYQRACVEADTLREFTGSTRVSERAPQLLEAHS